MTDRPTVKTGKDSLPLLAASLVFLSAVSILYLGIAASSLKAVLASTALAAFAMFLLPINALPGLSLWCFVLIPLSYMTLTASIARYISWGVLGVSIWMARTAYAYRRELLAKPIRGWQIVGPSMVLILISLLASNSGRLDVMMAWSLVFTMCVISPVILGQITGGTVWPIVRLNLAGIGIFLGVLALSDFILHVNPWMGWISADIAEKSWSVFRARTSLGHPLLTSTVASAAFAVCVFPSGNVRHWPYRFGAIGALTAVILSVSRAGVYAVALATLVGLLSAGQGARSDRSSHNAGRQSSGRRLLSVMVALTSSLAVVWSPLLSARNSSEEGTESKTFRSDVFVNAGQLIYERPLTGFGPGISSFIYEQRYGRFSIESSALQLMVSIGLPAFLILSVGILAAMMLAIRRGRPGVAAAITAYLVSASTFNVIDSNPAILALLSPLLFCAVEPNPATVGELSKSSRVGTARNGERSLYEMD